MAEPRIRFLIAGAQKAGTTALARYLAQHPRIALPDRLPEGLIAPPHFAEAWTKEAHVFDAPDFDDAWSVDEVDRRFAPRFSHWADADRLYGDATPVTLFHPRFVERAARYNPAMRWIVLLRDPVDRAISHWHMERQRGQERRSLLTAVLAEPFRLSGRWDDLSATAPWRAYSYVARGRYRRQIAALLRRVPSAQVLLVPSSALAQRPGQTVARVLAFLGLPPASAPAQPGRVFEGGYPRPGRWSPGRLLLSFLLRGERAALRTIMHRWNGVS